VIRVSRRVLYLVIGVAVVLLVLGVLARTGVVAAALEPTAVADPATMDVQRAAAERGIQRAYAGAVLQIEQSKQLKLAISDKQASDLRTKALADLKTLRHSALVSTAGALGSSAAESERYASLTEAKLDIAPTPDRTSQAAVLLAPRLFTIVQRMDEVAPQITDKVLRELTVPPTPRPSASP
jgi:hypothetical protein